MTNRYRSFLSVFVTVICLSASTVTAEPSYGFWNTNLNQTNVVECHNLSLRSKTAQLTIYSASRQPMAVIPLGFSGRSTRHVVINPYTGENRYGTFEIADATEAGTSATLRCHTAIYRLNSAPNFHKRVDYAYILPSGSPIRGISNGTFNAMDPAAGSNTVLNWLTIYNASAAPLSGRVEILDLSGRLIPERTTYFANINPGYRTDLAMGHQYGQITGMYRIIPEDDSQSYSAYLVRYAPRETRFVFAIATQAIPSSSLGFDRGCNHSPLLASTMNPAFNWVELVNYSNTPGEASLRVYDQSGTLKGDLFVYLSGNAQRHIRVNEFLGDRNIGTIRLHCPASSESKIGMTSFHYGFSDALGTLEWAYASQQSEPDGDSMRVVSTSVNTHLGAANWSLYLNHTDSEASSHDLRLLATDGTLTAERSFTLPRTGSIAQDIHSMVGSDFIGISISRSLDSTTSYGAELLRVFPTDQRSSAAGEIGFIMRVPAYSVRLSSQTAYFRTMIGDSSIVIKLTDSQRINAARQILADPMRSDRSIMGRVMPLRTDYNEPWSFSLDPSSISFFEQAIEVCDYPITLVESEIRARGETLLPDQIWCPWSSRLVEELAY